MATWPEESTNIKESLMGGMVENENLTLVEEGEDILDGLETMNVEDEGGDEKDKETKAEEWVQQSAGFYCAGEFRSFKHGY